MVDHCCVCRGVLRGSDDHVHNLCDDDSYRAQLSPSQARHVQHVTMGTAAVADHDDHDDILVFMFLAFYIV